MKRIIVPLMAVGIFAALPAAAQTAPAEPMTSVDTTRDSTFSVAVTGGTLGVGPEIGWRLSDHIGIRGSATFLSVSASFDSEDAEYDGKVKLNSFGGMIDVYPFGSNFRLSGGARINNNAVDVSLMPTGATDVGDVEYTAAQIGRIDGRAEPKKFSPALTLGWSGSNRRGFIVGMEAGALFQGAFKLDEFTATGTARDNPGFRASLERERVSLQSDVDKVKVYPILQFAIGYRF